MAAKRKISKKQLVVYRIVGLLLVILLLLFIAAETFNVATVSSINDGIKNFFSSLSSGDGYPYQINSSSVEKMTVLNGNLFVLTDGKTMTLDSTAKEVKNTQHTYSSPILTTSSGKALVYDRDGNRYRVENRTDTVFEGTTPDDEKLITCAIGKKGNIALATLSDKATSKLTVLGNGYSKELFVWQCASDTVASVALSDNGKYAAVSVIGAREGEIYSKVYIFDFNYAEPVSEFEYFGTAIVGVHFASNNNVVAVGDNLISFISGLKNKKDIEFGTSTLSSYTFSNKGETVLVLSEYGSTNSEILTCYSSSFDKMFEQKFTSNVKSLYAADSKVAVLLDDKAIVYRTSGATYKTYDVDTNSISVFNLGNNTYIYAIGKIVKC